MSSGVSCPVASGDVFGPDLNVLEREGWRWREPHLVIRHGRRFFERLCDELIAPEELIDSWDPFHAALGRCYERYRDLLQGEGSTDFDHLQRWAAELLEDDRVAGPISAGIRYLICDEYQDTSYVQEHILLRLCRDHGNICVVGDDDQSIYRFRGASVRNLLEFPWALLQLSYRGAQRQLSQPSRHRGFLRPVDGHCRRLVEPRSAGPAVPAPQVHHVSCCRPVSGLSRSHPCGGL